MAGTSSDEENLVQLFYNRLPERLTAELDRTIELGIRVVRPREPGFDDVLRSGRIKWVVTEHGQLVVVAKWFRQEEVPHTVMTEGRPVLAAGEGEVASTGVTRVGIEITTYSGHYAPRPESLRVGRAAFAQFGIRFP